jgi:sugar O-acyltransferase (sialic acid O-acetyltransferase NeuD family)
MRILIIGAGGHGQVVADILQQMQAAGAGVQPVGFLDDNPALLGEKYLGLPVLGSEKSLPAIVHDAVIVAIGNNRTRQNLFLQLMDLGEQFATAQHPKAIIAPDVQVGPGCMIMAGVIVNIGSTIAQNTILNTACTVDHHSRVAAHAHIAPGVHLGGEVTIEEGALIGIGATVMPQRSVGAWAVVGAGSLVHAGVPDNTVVAGVPARTLKEK